VNGKSTRVFVTGSSLGAADPNFPDFETIAYALGSGDIRWARRYRPGGYPYALSFSSGRVFVGGDWTDGEGNGGAVVIGYSG
jgi:hypothetical protein